MAKPEFSLWHVYTHFICTTEKGRSNRAIKTQYKTPKSKWETIYKCKGNFNTKSNYRILNSCKAAYCFGAENLLRSTDRQKEDDSHTESIHLFYSSVHFHEFHYSDNTQNFPSTDDRPIGKRFKPSM